MPQELGQNSNSVIDKFIDQRRLCLLNIGFDFAS